jgi:hypothetical protein
MSSFHPIRGLAVLVAIIGVAGCEAAKSANPVAPSSTAAPAVATVSEPGAGASPARIDAPTAMAPSGRLNNNTPDFFVTNGTIEGASAVVYFFEISTSADFSQIAAVVSAPVNDTGTTMMSLGSLAYGGTYYWRARGSDGSTESDYSNTLSFTLPSGPNAPASGDPVASIPWASWTTDQWRTYFHSLVEQKGGPTVSDAGMHAMRADLLARGADFQNGWRGDVRPRLFLPVAGCPIANRRDVPACSYSRAIDLGGYGQEWRWIVR